MTTKFSLVLAVLLSFSAASAQQLQQQAALSGVPSERLAYDVKFGGLKIGQVLLTLESDEWAYRSRVDVVSGGIVDWVTNFQLNVEGRGAFDVAGSGQPMPMSFKRAWSADEIAASMTISHDPNSGVATMTESYVNPQTGDVIDPAERYDWAKDRVDVPAGLRVGVFDPIGAFIYARHLITAYRETEFNVPLYDGRRRYDMTVSVGETAQLEIDGKTVDSRVVTLDFKPVFGFDEEHAERLQETEAKLYFSADDRFVPYRLNVSFSRGSAVMELSGDCQSDIQVCQELAARIDG